MRSQIVTSNKGRGGDSYLPYVFTEQGVTQLSTVLRSKTAIEVNIRIMDAFVAMRRFLSANSGMFQRIEKVEHHQILTDKKIELVPKLMLEQAEVIHHRICLRPRRNVIAIRLHLNRDDNN